MLFLRMTDDGKWRDACSRFRFNFVKPTVIASTIDATGRSFLRAFVVIHGPRAQPCRDEQYYTPATTSNCSKRGAAF